jgi:hypothetical protein
MPQTECFLILQINNGKMVFAKLKNFFAKLIFFPPNFFFVHKDVPFPKYQNKFWREKINLAKKVGPLLIHQSPGVDNLNFL